MKARIVLAVVAASLAAVGCGRAEQTPLTSDETPAETPKSDTSKQAANRKDTALGRLCAAHFELGDRLGQLALALSNPKSEEAAPQLTDVKQFFNKLPDALGSSNGLPKDAEAFRRELITAARSTSDALAPVSPATDNAERSATFEEISNHFGFIDTGNPAADGFEKAVREDRSRSCPPLAEMIRKSG